MTETEQITELAAEIEHLRSTITLAAAELTHPMQYVNPAVDDADRLRRLRDDNGRVAANLTAALAPKEERDARTKALGELLVRMSEARKAGR